MNKFGSLVRKTLLFSCGAIIATAFAFADTAQAGDGGSGEGLYNKTKVWEDENGTVACGADPSNCYMAIKPPTMPNPPSAKLLIGERDGVTIVDTRTLGTYYVVIADETTGVPIGY